LVSDETSRYLSYLSGREWNQEHLTTIPSQAKVRFGRDTDLDWCTIESDDIPKEVVRRKLQFKEIILAESGKERLGYLRMEYLWSKIPYVALIRVRKKHRRRGVGRAMLQFLEGYLRKRRYRVLMSSSQVDALIAQAWHRAMGFEECGIISGINPGGIGEVFFRKSLTRRG
jgi:ribosomal protein S18 acetylase RimI-like enzyme